MMNKQNSEIELKFKNKELFLTGHFKEELYSRDRKNLDLILEGGEHKKEGKEKNSC